MKISAWLIIFLLASSSLMADEWDAELVKSLEAVDAKPPAVSLRTLNAEDVAEDIQPVDVRFTNAKARMDSRIISLERRLRTLEQSVRSLERSVSNLDRKVNDLRRRS